MLKVEQGRILSHHEECGNETHAKFGLFSKRDVIHHVLGKVIVHNIVACR